MTRSDWILTILAIGIVIYVAIGQHAGRHPPPIEQGIQ